MEAIKRAVLTAKPNSNPELAFPTTAFPFGRQARRFSIQKRLHFAEKSPFATLKGVLFREQPAPV